MAYEREKLVNSIVFFAKKVKGLGKVKLFKLLYFVDLEHFRQTGRTLTGLEYKAMKMGPVPQDLYNELDNVAKHKDLRAAIIAMPAKSGKSHYDRRSENAVIIKAKATFDKQFFSKRELDILEKIVEVYKDVLSNDISDIAHNRDLPWYKVFVEDKNINGPLPFDLAIGHKDTKVSQEDLDHIRELDDYASKVFG